MLESGLIEHCAPTLAGLKSANLFNYYFDLKRDVFKELREVNQKLNERGVYIEPLLQKNTFAAGVEADRSDRISFWIWLYRL